MYTNPYTLMRIFENIIRHYRRNIAAILVILLRILKGEKS